MKAFAADETTVVRLRRIVVRRLRNVTAGEVDLGRPRAPEGGGLLAVYGRNGSGKTALVDAIALLKAVMSGRTVPARFADLIGADAETAEIEAEWRVTVRGEDPAGEPTAESTVVHRIEIARSTDESGRAAVRVVRERLACGHAEAGETRIRRTPVIDTNSAEEAFLPDTRLRALLGEDGRGRTETPGTLRRRAELLVRRETIHASGRSFVFSRALADAIAAMRARRSEPDPGRDRVGRLLERLRGFAEGECFVADASASGFVPASELLLACGLGGPETAAAAAGARLGAAAEVIPEAAFAALREAAERLNGVLGALVPGLSIGIRDLGAAVLPSGAAGRAVELMSVRGGRAVPLRCESEGIRRLLAVLHLLVAVYNRPSVTVVIDGLDRDLSEPLLAGLLDLIDRRGRGQLVFTAHNLRLLDQIGPECAVFAGCGSGRHYARLPARDLSLREAWCRALALGDAGFGGMTSASRLARILADAMPEAAAALGGSAAEPRRVVLLLVEGPSDEDALADGLRRVYERRGAVLETATVGDLTAGATKANRPEALSERVGAAVLEQLRRRCWRPEDLAAVLHVTDTDGVFIPAERIVECADRRRFRYTDDGIECHDLNQALGRNGWKSENMRRLAAERFITVGDCRVPYRLLYMSRCLEHVISGNTGRAPGLKVARARRFADGFSGEDGAEAFERFFTDSDFAVGGGFEESWRFIERDVNSLRRHTNFQYAFPDRVEADAAEGAETDARK